jgi:hypothetical protein
MASAQTVGLDDEHSPERPLARLLLRLARGAAVSLGPASLNAGRPGVRPGCQCEASRMRSPSACSSDSGIAASINGKTSCSSSRT